MSRRKSKAETPRVLAPLRGCKFCGGYGWVKTLVAPAPKVGPGGKLSHYDPPSVRCSCTIPERRDQVAPEPAPARLDGAQRRSGEREEA
jgi:hypothetical protein